MCLDAWALNGRRGFAGWAGNNCMDWAADRYSGLGGLGGSHGHWAGDMDLVVLVDWDSILGG